MLNPIGGTLRFSFTSRHPPVPYSLNPEPETYPCPKISLARFSPPPHFPYLVFEKDGIKFPHRQIDRFPNAHLPLSVLFQEARISFIFTETL